METIFYRWNIEGSREFPITFKEKELRPVLAVSVRSVDRAIERLKDGKQIWTKYGVYSCSNKKPTR